MNNANLPAMPPAAGWRDDVSQARGLTKREHFAALAMQSLVGRSSLEEVATLAVDHADALLDELERRRGDP